MPTTTLRTERPVHRVLLLGCIVALGGAALPACARPASKVHAPPSDPRPERGEVPPAAPRSAALGPARTISVKLAVENERLRVRVVATGPSDELRAWRLGDDDVQRVDVRGADDRPIAFRTAARSVEVTGELRASTIALSYDLVASADAAKSSEDPRATRIEHARVRCVGERVLALPTAFEDKRADVAATIDVDARALDAPLAGSSFGVARDRPVALAHLRASELRRSAFVAGGGGHAVFDAPEGHDEAMWLGYTAFDPRAVSAEVAGFRGVLNEYFKATEPEPATLLVAVDARPKGAFRALRRAGGVLVALSGADAYDAPLRLAVAHELVHAWIGERIWLGDATPGAEARSFWFHEGVARWIAREQLSRVGLLPPDEYAAEVNRLLGIVATAPKNAMPMSELASSGPGALPILVARGALWATAIDARIREASKGKVSLDDALRALARRAAETRAPLPEGALDAAIADLGVSLGHTDFDEIVADGKRTRLADNALGGCFEPRDTTYDVLAPGFDVAASRATGRATGVDPKGPAAGAGLRDGDVLTHVDGAFDRTDDAVRIEVARAGGAAVVTYRPTSGARKGQAWKRREGLSENACKKLMPRR